LCGRELPATHRKEIQLSISRSRSATTTIAGCLALSLASPAVASAVTAHPASPAKPAAKATHTIKSGKTSLTIDSATFQAVSGAGFTLLPVKPAKLTPALAVTFPVTGGKVNTAKLTGTIRQTGGLSISKGGTTVVIKNAVANLSTRDATATVTGKGKHFFALKLGKPTKATSTKAKGKITGYTVSLSKKAIAYLDKKFATTIFKKNNELGTGTTTLKYKK
jgi:hypothetical protein